MGLVAGSTPVEPSEESKAWSDGTGKGALPSLDEIENGNAKAVHIEGFAIGIFALCIGILTSKGQSPDQS
jgi:hypothetical protein